MQRAILAVISYQYLFANFGAFLNSSSSESDERYVESRVPSWGGCWDFLGTINHLDDPCGCGYCRFGSWNISGSVTSIIWRFQRLSLMSMGLAVALILSNKAGSSSMSLDSYLFGSIITISSEQVRALFVIAAIVLVLTLLFIRPMYLLTFDEDTAHVDGLPVRLMSLLFNIVTGIAIALMIPAAGSLLVSTIMILPAAIGMKIGQTFKSVIFWAIGIGLIGMLSGIFISYYWETPASATITLIFIAFFGLVSIFEPLLKAE